MNQKGIAPILIVLILAALVGGYLVYQNQPKPTPSPQPTTQTSPTPTDICTNNTKVYKSLEEALKESDKVCHLDLSSKNLTQLPDGIFKLKNLESLYLNHNKLTTLPENISALTNLTSLDLTGNPISQDEVNKIKKLLPHPNAKVFLIQPMSPP